MLKFPLIILIIILCSLSFAQENEMEMDENQKAWMEYMKPGPMHELMGKTAGEWKTKSSFWMTPDSEPLVTEGSAYSEMIMGGRYMKMTYSGVMMGMPFEGMNLQAYDNATNEFIAVWIDNLGTGISVAKGIYEKERNSIFYVGSMVDPATGEDIKYKQIVKLIGDDHQIFEMYTEYEGEEFKSVQVELTR